MASEQAIRRFPVVTIFSKYATPDRGLMEAWKTHLSHIPVKLLDYQRPEEMLPSLQEAEIILSDPDIIGPLFNKLPKAKWVQGTWAGIDDMLNLVNPSHLPPSFTYTRLGQGLRTSMAEYVIGHMIARERHFAELRKAQEEKLWKQKNYRVLKQLTLGIIGLGDIGEEIARLCKAFGMRIWGLGRRELPKEKWSENVDEYRPSSGLKELLAECDYICNVLPKTPATTDMFSGDVLSNCTKNPVFMNIGRGNVVSEEALLNALDQGWISHAILDVFRTEPLPASSALWSSPKVTITPHCAANTYPFSEEDSEYSSQFLFPNALIEVVQENYNRYINGEPLKFTVDWNRGY